MRKTAPLILASCLGACLALSPLAVSSQTATAGEVVVPVSKQSPELMSTPRPANGMSMTSVEQTYGTPVSVSGPVGNPAITTWEYQLFTVYFEGNLVIHTVLKHNPN
jgi:ABC-type oligopeptide transport system substrate-binding subunit